MTGARPGGPDDVDNVRLNEGRGRFYVEAKSIGGGTYIQKINSHKIISISQNLFFRFLSLSVW